MTVTVTRLRAAAGATDRYGDPTDGTDNELAIHGCGLAPRTDEENTSNGRRNGRHGVPIGWTLYAPYGADIEPTDRVRLPDGTVCDVEGEPADWEHMWTDWQAGTAVALKRYEG